VRKAIREIIDCGVAMLGQLGGIHIRIFVFTDLKNYRFQKILKEINNAEHEYMNMDPPQLSSWLRP
jgi:hypothetical protein